MKSWMVFIWNKKSWKGEGSQSISETKGTSLGGQLLSNVKHENEEQKHCERKLGFVVSVRLTLEFNTIKSYLNMFLDDKECCWFLL